MPALLASTSIDLNRDNAVSTILAAVAGSPMCPSTRATWLEAATSVDWVIFRELATTLNPSSTNAFTIPAPIPCEAPVTMAVFCLVFIVSSLEFSLDRFGSISIGELLPSASNEIEQQRLSVIDCLELQNFFLTDSGAVAGVQIDAIQRHDTARALDEGMASRL